MTEFLHGPIWVYDKEGFIDSLSLVEEDFIIKELDKEMADMYSSYYEFDSHGEACWFNKEKQSNNTDIKPTFEINNLEELKNIL